MTKKVKSWFLFVIVVLILQFAILKTTDKPFEKTSRWFTERLIGNEYLIFIFFLIAVLILFVLVLRDTKRKKGIFGANYNKGVCPKCKKKWSEGLAPFPKNLKEWHERASGAWTCEYCGCKVDHWGSEVLSS